MKVYLIDSKRITKYNLPSKIDEDFLINYQNDDLDEENTITIEAVNDKWRLRSNGNVNIVNGDSTVEEVTLENYDYHYLKLLGKNTFILLFSIPSQENELYTLDYTNTKEITIGLNSSCNVCYRNNLMSDKTASIVYENNIWVFRANENTKSPVFVNSKKSNYCKLKYGDIIFINGLKIIWMKDFLKINNPKNLVSVTNLNAYNYSLSSDNTNCEFVSDEENNVDLYNADEYFYHIPRVKETIEDKKVDIDTPPKNEIKEDVPFILSLGSSLTMLASSFVMAFSIYNGMSTGTRKLISFLPQFVMLFAMLLGSIILPKLLKRYQKKNSIKREKLRQKKYKEYLTEKEEEMKLIMKHQTDILNENNEHVLKCYETIMNHGRKLWNREILDDDFLTVRLGLGTVYTRMEVNAPEEHFTLDKDNLFEAVYKVVEETKKINNVPITYSFLENNMTAMIFNCSYKYDYINGIITQLIGFQSGLDLKIVVLTNNKNSEYWNYFKILPHCWNDDRSVRFFSTNLEELNEVSNYLDDVLKKRKEAIKKPDKVEDGKEVNPKDEYKNFSTYYLIITDDYQNIKNCQFILDLLRETKNYGFSFVTIADKMKNLPNRCEKFIQVSEQNSCILTKELNEQTQTQFSNEYVKDLDMEGMSIKLANIPIMSKDGLTVLPNSLSFLDMFNVSKIEQLNVQNRWQIDNPVTSLATTIGVHSNLEPFKLDLHEKYHGPHGLIAGSTGSGKSEFIITYILSIALNYHPYEVQFVLIDYKGGGLAGAFENKETGVRLPHLIGTITNLDTSEMNRTLVSIESELKRRQKIFNTTRDAVGESTIDIYKYQRLYREGVVKEPLAHLFIIADEFAELKSQQPEFMAQLITTARIGRSLGVHLILATQKPSGVVNDQIWSNSKFKVCLKVQDRSDSMEMLKRPEAASIKEAGRFYLQVGYDDYFDIGQSGWSGAKYVPTNKIIKKVDDSICFVNNVGYVTKTINNIVKKEATTDYGDQLTNIVKYIYSLAKKENIVTKKLWLDKIPEIIYVDKLRNKYNYRPKSYFINPVIGEYDNPSNQEQGLLNLNLTTDGNTVIYGQSGSGKENLISTILWSSIVEHTPDEVNIYIIDCGAETLKTFYKMPHVGAIADIDNPNMIVDILKMANEELDKRKELFSDYAGSYLNYLENSGKKLPLLIFVINGYDNFSEAFNNLSEQIQPMFRECSKYGIDFIVSAALASSIRTRMVQNFPNKIAMQMPSDLDYRSYLNAPKELLPSKFFGRGIIALNDSCYEFQTAYISDLKVMNNVIKEASKKLNEAYKTRAKEIVALPDKVFLSLVKDKIYDLSKLPVGINIETKQVETYNFIDDRINLIISDEMDEKMEFVYGIAREMTKVKDTNVYVIDFVGGFTKDIPDVKLYNNDYDKAMANISNILRSDKDSEIKNIYLIVAPGNMKYKLSDVGSQIVNNMFMHANILQNNYFILVDDYANVKSLKIEPWYQCQVDSSNGIWIGTGIGSQMSINVSNLTIENRKIDFPYLAFTVSKGKQTVIKCILDEDIDKEAEIIDEE